MKTRLLLLTLVLVSLFSTALAGDTYDVAAFYWPSCHFDERWATFFPDGSQGEWESIRNCKPKWEGHYQPRVPAWGYLMDNDPKAMEKKIAAATSHGVNVMIFDWYWFENKPFLESALNDGFLKAKNVDKMKFYLMWANHDSSTHWDIRRSHEHEVLWPGSVDLPTFKTIVARVIKKYFSHPSYYKIDGKPVFSIYDMNNLLKGFGGVKQTVEALDYFRAQVKKAGFDGLHIQMIYWGRVPKIDDSGFASAKGTTANTIKMFKIDSVTNYQFVHLARPEADYVKWADKALSNWPKWSKEFDVPYFPHVSIGWDNNTRFVRKMGAVTENVNPETFKKYLVKAKAYADAHPDQPKLITINAWNEWVEGSYLEPDERFGMGYLQALRDVFVSPENAQAAIVWQSQPPEDCPFEESEEIAGLAFTGRHSDYRCGDTFYPCWASDGNMYSPWTDGKTDGIVCQSGWGDNAHTGHALMIGDDPLKLIIKNTSPPKKASAKPYKGRYPCGSLVHNGIWYYGTYCLGPAGSTKHKGFTWNWPNLGPIPGFQISRDMGKTWTDSPLSPENPLFPEPDKYLGPVKMGAPHFVDFGQNMKHSPDGKAYMLGMGAMADDPKPRPCVKPATGGGFEVQDCDTDFAHANLSWITADQVYLARVTPSPETINDFKAYEFFAGHDKKGKAVWTGDFEKIKPLIEWNNNMGCVTATYVPGLKKYLMCITDGWPTVAKMSSYILEADQLTGPWRMVVYMKDFGEQAYFLNFPSKFISEDGKTLWLCYSANFSGGWNGVKLNFNPPGGRYGLCLHEVKLLGKRKADKSMKPDASG